MNPKQNIAPWKHYSKVETFLCVYGLHRIDDLDRIDLDDLNFTDDHIKNPNAFSK